MEEIKLPAWISEVESLAVALGAGKLPVSEHLRGIYRLLGVDPLPAAENQPKGINLIARLVQEIRDLMAIVHDLRQDAPTVYTVERVIQGEMPESMLLGVYHSKTDALRYMSIVVSSLRDYFVPWFVSCVSWEGEKRTLVAKAASPMPEVKLSGRRDH